MKDMCWKYCSKYRFYSYPLLVSTFSLCTDYVLFILNKPVLFHCLFLNFLIIFYFIFILLAIDSLLRMSTVSGCWKNSIRGQQSVEIPLIMARMTKGPFIRRIGWWLSLASERKARHPRTYLCFHVRRESFSTDSRVRAVQFMHL